MGGGLCGDCLTNHQSGQIFEPPYLFNTDGTEAVRPSIDGNDIIASAGDTINISGSPNITEFNMVRLVALTHHHTTDHAAKLSIIRQWLIPAANTLKYQCRYTWLLLDFCNG